MQITVEIKKCCIKLELAHLLGNIVIQEMLEQEQLKKRPTVSGGGAEQ